MILGIRLRLCSQFSNGATVGSKNHPWRVTRDQGRWRPSACQRARQLCNQWPTYLLQVRNPSREGWSLELCTIWSWHGWLTIVWCLFSGPWSWAVAHSSLSWGWRRGPSPRSWYVLQPWRSLLKILSSHLSKLYCYALQCLCFRVVHSFLIIGEYFNSSYRFHRRSERDLNRRSWWSSPHL